MATYMNNILPDWSSSAWSYTNATASSASVLIMKTGGAAAYRKKVTAFSAKDYAVFSCSGISGQFYVHLVYQDTESKLYQSITWHVVAGVKQIVELPSATTNELLFIVRCSAAGTIRNIKFQLAEQAIRTVDIEYASGDSKVNPPTTGWSTTPPQWQTNRYIWQRTATTFIDGHIEYSDPVCIQKSSTVGIYQIEEQYYLSTSQTGLAGGSWSTTAPTWETEKYIWTRSKITWTDQSVTYTDPVLAKNLNDVNERVEEVDKKVDDLDDSLDQKGVFDRLTNNGKAQGLFIDSGNIYVNATYVRSGILEVVDADKKLVFKADMDSKSVYLAGFTATNNTLTYNRKGLEDANLGTYIGTDGFSVAGVLQVPNQGKVNSFMSLTNGMLEGGNISGTDKTVKVRGTLSFGAGPSLDSDESIYITGNSVHLRGGLTSVSGSSYGIISAASTQASIAVQILGTQQGLHLPSISTSLYGGSARITVHADELLVYNYSESVFYEAQTATMYYMHHLTYNYTTYPKIVNNVYTSNGYVYYDYYENVKCVSDISWWYHTRKFLNGFMISAGDTEPT